MSTDSAPNKRRALHWVLGIAAVLLVLVTLVTAGALWFFGRYVRTGPPPQQPPTAAANWSRATFKTSADDGLKQTSDKSWSVKGGRAFMNVRRKDDGSLELRFVYPFDSLPRETVALIQTRWGLKEVEKLADTLSITPEQLAELKTVSPATDMPVSSADKQNLRALFENYLATKDPASETAVVQAVGELDARYYDATRERIEAAATQVKNIFNADQQAALLQRFGPRTVMRSLRD